MFLQGAHLKSRLLKVRQELAELKIAKKELEKKLAASESKKSVLERVQADTEILAMPCLGDDQFRHNSTRVKFSLCMYENVCYLEMLSDSFTAHDRSSQ